MVVVEEVVEEADLAVEEEVEVSVAVAVAAEAAVVEVEVVDVAAVLFETETTKIPTRRPRGRKAHTDRQMTLRHHHEAGAEEATRKGKHSYLLTRTTGKHFSVAFKSENRSANNVPRRRLTDR